MAERTIKAELTGTVIAVERNIGDSVAADDIILVMESMKMEMPIATPMAGCITWLAAEGDQVAEGQPLVKIAS